MKKIKRLIDKYKIEYVEGDHIYLLLNGDEIVYVGRTIKIYPPISNHNDKEFTHVSMPPIEAFEYDGTVEELYFKLIIELKPKYNTILPNNDLYMRKSVMKKRFNVDGYEINRLIKKNGAQPVYLDYYDIRDIFKYES